MSSVLYVNRNSLSRTAVTLATVLFSLTVSHAQSLNGVNTTGNDGNEEIQGTIHFPAGHKAGMQPVIKLQGNTSGELTALANFDGSFSFTRLRPDSYTIIVNGGDEYENARETVAIGNSGPVPAQGNPFDYAHPLVYQVQIYLRPKRSNVLVNGTAVNGAALANVPQAARDLFDKGMESAGRGESEKAIEQFKGAISQAPNFALAYHQMGLQYLKLGKADKAADAFSAAIKLGPEEFETRLNYGFALLNLKKFAAAKQQLRQALQHNETSATAHYYLALALMNLQEYQAAEAEFQTSIRNSKDGMAPAHKYLGGIYWRNKQYGPAADELERYLNLDAKAPDAARIRTTIKELRSKDRESKPVLNAPPSSEAAVTG